MGRAFSPKGSFPTIKNHAAASDAKAEIRNNVLNEVGTEARVFDAFAGTGQMWRLAWRRAAGYVGCDKEWMRDGRVAFVCDNRRVMRAIDLSEFSIFDFDAFGSPWEQVVILTARRKIAGGERLGLVLTEGSSLSLRQGRVPGALASLAGLSGHLAGLARWHNDIVDKALNEICRRMGAEITHRWHAQRNTGANMRYIGLVLRGLKNV